MYHCFGRDLQYNTRRDQREGEELAYILRPRVYDRFFLRTNYVLFQGNTWYLAYGFVDSTLYYCCL